ncbi:MAG: hypothetical protein MMC23_006430 [Stictis urceolatum]|nr:hypothetical protein [Stictis urceolata]
MARNSIDTRAAGTSSQDASQNSFQSSSAGIMNPNNTNSCAHSSHSCLKQAGNGQWNHVNCNSLVDEVLENSAIQQQSDGSGGQSDRSQDSAVVGDASTKDRNGAGGSASGDTNTCHGLRIDNNKWEVVDCSHLLVAKQQSSNQGDMGKNRGEEMSQDSQRTGAASQGRRNSNNNNNNSGGQVQGDSSGQDGMSKSGGRELPQDSQKTGAASQSGSNSNNSNNDNASGQSQGDSSDSNGSNHQLTQSESSRTATADGVRGVGRRATGEALFSVDAKEEAGSRQSAQDNDIDGTARFRSGQDSSLKMRSQDRADGEPNGEASEADSASSSSPTNDDGKADGSVSSKNAATPGQENSASSGRVDQDSLGSEETD